MHVTVVAIAAPLLALDLAGTRADPSRRRAVLFAPVPAAVVELAVVWGWHAPGLHHAAHAHAAVLSLEQAMFLGAGLLVWLGAFGGAADHRPVRAASGIVSLLMTSMHMTLLGVLLTLAPRSLYALEAGGCAGGVDPLIDQQAGDILMLLVGGGVYLAGGVALTAGLLSDRNRPASRGPGVEP